MDGAEYWAGLASAGRLIEVDFPVRPRSRRDLDEDGGGPLMPKLVAGHDLYASHLATFSTYRRDLARIPSAPTSPTEPHWVNDWIPAVDALSLYGFVAARNPRYYLEIGSGTSTKFVRRAIEDQRLRTRIVSIDPLPRSDIDALCDEIHRVELENADLAIFDRLGEGDVVFCDGSHRAFQNSDATVFMTEVVPRLRAGVLAGVHDIFLPWDYPGYWAKRYYSEQYLLACYLLGGDALRIEFPVLYVAKTPDYQAMLKLLWDSLPEAAGANRGGGIFWFAATGSQTASASAASVPTQSPAMYLPRA
jgi:hypothetical protein